MKKELIFIQAFLVVLFAACQSTSGPMHTKHGYEYKIIESTGKGNLIKPGDKILYSQSVYKNDTLIQSAVNIETLPDETKFKNVPANLDLIFLLRKGDSAVVSQKFDTAAVLPRGLAKKDVIKFAIRVIELTDATDASNEMQQGLIAKNELAKGLAKMTSLYNKDSLQNVKSTPSGLKYIVSRTGTGKPILKGERAVVHFIGMRQDGSEFDSSFNRGAPFVFKAGVQEVIPGWDEALSMFPRGSRVIIICPPSLAYGEKGNPPVIPANSTLFFYMDIQDKVL
jgi:FKBP-type peptidyl-prolyl cis-trans isomerase